MAIPDNYIDKITKEGDSRMISPAAKMVRVNNENFEGSDLDEVLDEVSAAIDEAGSGGYAPPPGGIPATDLAPAVQTSLGKADTAVQPGDLSAVATSGNYNDLSNKPTIPDVSGLATKNEVNTGLAGKVDKNGTDSLMTAAEHTKLQNLPSNPVQSVTINGTTPTVGANGNVNLGTVVGAQGPKGDTGNVQVDGNGNVLIVNNLDDGGTGAALSAEMGKRLALKAGTYAGAWARSKAVIVPFCWLWQETVGGAAISKPIWHIGNSVFVDAAGGIVNVQASAIPAAPTFSETSGSTVGKGTELTITPDTDSALYYKIGNGAWIVSDVAVTIEINATCTVTAKCVNNAGSSSEVACSLTVSGPQTPRFSAKPGTTIDNNNVVSRGGYVVITGEAGGTLNYKVNEGSYIGVQSVGGAAPTAEVQITEAKTIMAYNTINGENSAVITQPYTMAALAAPSMSPASSQLPAGGGTVEITGPAGANIYYTLDGSTPTDQSTLYSGLISVTDGKTIKAIAKDNYGYSDVTTETYTVAVDHKFQFKIKLTGDNSTEYVPVTGIDGAKYNMTVDWGDGTTTDYSNNGADMHGVNKGCSHTYSGSEGDEFTITLRGSRIDSLMFDSSCHNTGAITEIVDNSLECDTNFTTVNTNNTFNFGNNCTKVCANALQNNIGRQGLFCAKLTSIPNGLLSHMTKNPNGISTLNSMFKDSTLDISSSLMAELKSIISTVVDFGLMFSGFKGSVTISDDFFDDVVGEVTSVWGMTNSAQGITGDAKKIYDALSAKASQSISSNYALTCSSLTNRNQVPTTWGGTMS